MSASPSSRPNVYLETFGCQMNELDSELVTGALRGLGYEFTSERESAEVVLYNTCSVREHAEQKVWSRLGEDKLRKAERPGMVIGVLGCMAERDGKDLIRRMPQVDILCGPGELDKLPTLLDNAVRTRRAMLDAPPTCVGATDRSPVKKLKSASEVALQGSTSRRSATLAAAEDTLELLDLSRSVSAVEHHGSAYVRITRGCNKFCTYCVVPFTRGAEMHRPPEHIVDECKRLADAGVVEVTLLGQTVNHYRFEHHSAVTLGGVVQPQKGRSYKGGHRADPFRGEHVTTFADLLARIHEEVPSIQRLRFVTSYPRDFGDDVLQVIRDHPRICRYLHVPAQSGSNRILGMMNRGYSVEEYDEFLVRAREYLHQPEIGRPLSVAGDIIVGFPTETDEDFAKTVAMVERSRYKNCFIFKYSPRPGTIAYDKIPDDVPEEVKRRRNNELLAVQDRVGEEVMREYHGMMLEVFVEGLSVHEQKRREGKLGASGHAKNGHGGGGVSLTVGGKVLGGGGGSEREPGRAAPEVACSTNGSHVYGEPDAAAVEHASLQLSARTDGDVIVHIDVPTGSSVDPRSLVGRVVPVRIIETRSLALRGELAR